MSAGLERRSNVAADWTPLFCSPSPKPGPWAGGTILSVASRGGAGLLATNLRFLRFGRRLGFRSLLAVCTGAPALGGRDCVPRPAWCGGSLACDGAFDSCACGGADSGASILAGSTCGAAGGRHRYHSSRLAVRVTVAGADDSGPDDQRKRERRGPTSNLPLTASALGQVLSAISGIWDLQLGRRRVGFGNGTATVRRRLLGAELIGRPRARHVACRLGSLVGEQFRVVLGQARHHIVIGARDEICPARRNIMRVARR